MLSELPSDLVSALVVPGQMLAMQGDEAALWRQLTPEAKNADALATQIAETTIELQRMPPIVSAILGITAGGAVPDLTQETPSSGTRDIPVSRLVVALTMIHMDAATTGAEVVADRLAHGSHPPLGNLPERPYRDVFADYEVRVASAEPVITITLTPAPGISPTILFNLLFTRALTFVGWSL
jgi:hypothetical protein